MSQKQPVPLPAEACLETPYPSSQKGGTLIHAGVVDLQEHERNLSAPDSYRPSCCATCQGQVLHLHDRRERKLKGEDGLVLITTVLRYRCMNSQCQARWQVLPQLIPRHLHYCWQSIEDALRPPQEAKPAKVPKTTKQRWTRRLRCSALRLLKALKDKGCTLLNPLLESPPSRELLLQSLRCSMDVLAMDLHRLAAGMRLL